MNNINNNKDEKINNDKNEKISVSNSENKLDLNTNNNNNINEQKEVNKEKKKEKKAYLNFIQNIKKANKGKKNKVKNIFEVEDPKAKLSRAINKIKILNRGFLNAYKNIDKEENEKEKEEQNKIKEERTEVKNETPYLEEIKAGYTGFILLKQVQGANIFQIKLEGNLEEINKIFKTHKIEIDGGQVEFIHTKELDKLRNKNIKNENNDEITYVKNENEKQNNLGMKEVKEDPLLAAVRKKTLETENVQKEEDNMKIKEMKERIQKYKNELRKGTELDDNIVKLGKERLSYYSKNRDSAMQERMKEQPARKISDEEYKNLRKSIKQNNNTLEKDGIDKNQFNTINNERDIKKDQESKEDKQKERDKSLSRAMDRLKRRNKREKENNSLELKSKKSEKISEIAKRLENVIGKQDSAEIKIEDTSNEIVKEKDNNIEEIYESVQVVSKKPKKPKKFQL